MADQYGISENELKIIQAQAASRAAMRKEFMKQSTHPWKHASGAGGYVFDPAIQRFMSMKVTQFDHFKPNITNTFQGFFLTIVPMAIFGYCCWKERTGREAKVRKGEVAYRDRLFKFQ